MMNLIHRSTYKVSNRLAVIAALVLAFSSFASLDRSSEQRESLQSASVQKVTTGQSSQDENSKARRLSLSLMFFGRG